MEKKELKYFIELQSGVYNGNEYNTYRLLVVLDNGIIIPLYTKETGILKRAYQDTLKGLHLDNKFNSKF